MDDEGELGGRTLGPGLGIVLPTRVGALVSSFRAARSWARSSLGNVWQRQRYGRLIVGRESQAESVSYLRPRAVAQVQLWIFCNGCPLETIALVAFGEICILFRRPSRQRLSDGVLTRLLASRTSWLLRITPRSTDAKGRLSFVF